MKTFLGISLIFCGICFAVWSYLMVTHAAELMGPPKGTSLMIVYPNVTLEYSRFKTKEECEQAAAVKMVWKDNPDMFVQWYCQ